MTFIIYSNLALEFIALAAGTALLIWAFQKKGDGSALATFVGTLIIILSFITVIGTIFSGGRAWMTGQLNIVHTPTPQKETQMQELDQKEQMVERMKNKLKGQKGPSSSQ